MASNTRLYHRPHLSDEAHLHISPPWFSPVLRALSALFGGAALFFATRDWDTMPFFAKAICAVLVPSFFIGAFSAKVWRFPIEFMADRRGVFIPADRFYAKGEGEKECWLFVPWENIDNIRIGRPDDPDSSRGIGFDMRVTPEEEALFLSSLHRLTDRSLPPGFRSVAFTNALPAQRATLKKLLALRQGA